MFDMKPDTEIRFRHLATWYLAIEEIKGKASIRQMEYRINLLDNEIGFTLVSDIRGVLRMGLVRFVYCRKIIGKTG